MLTENTQRNKEPWFAVNMSWLIPGCGQLYLNRYARTTIFVVLIGLFHILWLFSLMSPVLPVISIIVIRFFGLLALPAFASLDALKLAKKMNAPEFEQDRALSKDPWIATFLSLLLPGLGHLYLRKFFLFVLYVGVFLGVRISMLPARNPAVFAVLCILRLFVCIHAYASCPLRRESSKTKIIVFGILLISVKSLSTIFVPLVTARYLVERSYVTGSSMSPIIKNNDGIMVNKLAYLWDGPQVGDIVLLRVPETESFSSKQIIAVGGETIQVKDAKVYVNGKERAFKISHNADQEGSGKEGVYEIEVSGSYLIYGVDEPYRVPKNCYFVLGQNIRYSVDSRYFGAVSEKDIIGKIVKIYWPASRIRTLY